MKRHESISPLSRDHHTALLCCWKLRQGIKKKVDAKQMALYVTYFLKVHLEPHFLEEESIVFTAVADDLTDQAKTEHKKIMLLAAAIEKQASVQLLLQFADSLDKHIRFEERKLFPLIEAILTANKLIEIGMQLHNTQTQDDYADQFWV